MKVSTKLVLGVVFFPFCVVFGDDGKSAHDVLPGVWKMGARVVRGRVTVSYQEEASMTIGERLPDGTYPIITRVYKRVVTEIPGLLNIPGCEDKTECIFDEVTEGLGSSFRSAFYVDYYAENWIDDLFTVKGNVMTADDGNGPIVFTKVKTLDGDALDDTEF